MSQRNPMAGLVPLLAPPTENSEPLGRWATVTSVSPLRIRPEGDEEPLDGTTVSLVPGLTVGNLVYIFWHKRQVIILGRVHTY